MRTEDDILNAMNLHGNTVWRICLLRMGSSSDAQDAFQETFCSYATHDRQEFQNDEHLKAWLIKVASNRCVDLMRKRRQTEPLDEALDIATPCEFDDDVPEPYDRVNEAMAHLPAHQRQAVYLTVCEGYSASEVAQMMDVPVNTVYSWIARGKQRLKETLS